MSDSLNGLELTGQLDNRSGKSIKLRDSLKVLFYRYNLNLNTPFHDSAYKSNDSLIDFVEQSGEVVVLSIPLKELTEIRSGSTYSLKINRDNFKKLVFSNGSLDNQYQLQKGFQLFVISGMKVTKKFT